MKEEIKTMRKQIKIFLGAISVFIAVYTAVFGYYYTTLPCYINASRDHGNRPGNNLSINETIHSNEPLRLGGFSAAVLREDKDGCAFYLGEIPVKSVSVLTGDRPCLIPCGTPFGIKCTTDGVMVISVEDKSPAQKAGIKAGDVIKSVNSVPVYSNEELSDAVQTSASAADIILERDNSELSISVAPQFNGEAYKIGAWVRDSAAGLGTLTFADPKTGKFGGLGHAVSDITTGAPIPLKSGEITSAEILGVIKGRGGSAGELCGSIASSCDIGELELNTTSGIFGKLNIPPDSKPIPIAYRQEVTTGAASILATVEGNSPKEYAVQIERINLLDLNGSKAMVIKITDKELLEKTGGIVRGMSGSPIIQNGRLIGAVTHVLLNDPTRGYGIFAETMLEAINS